MVSGGGRGRVQARSHPDVGGGLVLLLNSLFWLLAPSVEKEEREERDGTGIE